MSDDPHRIDELKDKLILRLGAMEGKGAETTVELIGEYIDAKIDQALEQLADSLEFKTGVRP